VLVRGFHTPLNPFHNANWIERGKSNLAKCFTTPELMRWPGIEQLYGPTLRQTRVFGPPGTPGVEGDIEEEGAASEAGNKRWEELHKRVVEHNIRTVAKYYTRITLERLTQLLDLPVAGTEDVLSSLVVSKTVYARIDRPAGTIDFRQPRATDGILNEWSNDVERLMVRSLLSSSPVNLWN
jgi:26S proteasome regulatory subunit N5